jgi:gliding motility-associated-like protein
MTKKCNCYKTYIILYFCLSLVIQQAYSQVSNYSFQQINGNYTEINGGFVLGTATANNFTAQALWSQIYTIAPSFSFNFNGFEYPNIYIHSTGYVTFGSPPTTGNYLPISTNQYYAGVVSAWDSRNGFSNIGGKTSEIRWEEVGTAPNRIIVIQWKNIRVRSSSSTVNTPYMNYQIRLYESNNIIEIAYGESGYAVGGSTNINASAQVGLRGGNFNDFNNRTNSTSISINASQNGNTRSDVQEYSTLNAIPGVHLNGKIYRWTPTTNNTPICTHPDFWGTSNAPAICTTNIINDIWAGQFSIINNVAQGTTYQFSSTISSDWLVLTDVNNNLLIQGNSPITWNASFSGNVRLHISLNNICNTDYFNFRNALIECLSCCNPCDINPPQITISPSSCTENGSASISNFSNQYSYLFNPAGPILDASGNIINFDFETSYTVIAENNECSSLPSSTFTINAQLSEAPQPIINVVDATCTVNGSASISNFSNQYSYLFNPVGPILDASGNIINFDFETNYTVIAENNECSSLPSSTFTINAQLSEAPQPIINIVDATCTENGSASISNFSNQYNYLFNPAGPTIDVIGNIINLTPGITYVVIANVGDCSSINSESFTINNASDIGLISPGNIHLCKGDSIVLTAYGGIDYTWILNNQTILSISESIYASQSGEYSVIISDNQCSAIYYVTVSVADSLVITGIVDNGSCGLNMGTISVEIEGGNAPYTFFWSNNGDSLTQTNLPSGNYSINVVDSIGCVATNEFEINNGNVFSINVNPQEATINIGDPISLNVSEGSSYYWSPEEGLSCTDCQNPVANPNTSTHYQVVVTNTDGCTDSAWVMITVDEDCCTLNIPNVFTPNGDGINDGFEITTSGIQSMNIEIYNRWGNKVWESNTLNNHWDGRTANGTEASEGTYFYLINAIDKKNQNITKTGNITLIK